MDACIRCGAAPEHRQDTATGRHLVVCPECKARGEASLSERYAVASWNMVNDDTLPGHECRKGGLPRFLQQGGKWSAACPGCGFRDHGYESLQGAISGWMREIRAQPKRRKVVK